MIRVLLVDDSPTQRRLLRSTLESDPEFQVVGEAVNGLEALDMCHRLKPDLVTMDIQMPLMNGYEAIKRIMVESPRPIVVMTSSYSDRHLGISFKALDCGALMVLGKPKLSAGGEANYKRILNQLKAMANVKVVGRRGARPKMQAEKPRPVPRPAVAPEKQEFKLFCIGASTGGPPAIQAILQGLEGASPPPICVVQHINKGFMHSLAKWLDETTPLPVQVATQGQYLAPGNVYLAPEDRHLSVTDKCVARLLDTPAVSGHRPSANALFESAAASLGAEAAGILLTGMGNDGAEGLLAMRRAGALTIAQDESSSIVFGMPREAIALGAVQNVLPLDFIAPLLRNRLARTGGVSKN